MSEQSEESFVKAMSRTEERLRSYARTFTRDQDAIEDLLQEVRLTAVRKRSEYDPATGDGGLTAWLKVILKNVALRYLKSRAVRGEVSWNGSCSDGRLQTMQDAEHALRQKHDDECWERERRIRRTYEQGECLVTLVSTELTELQWTCMVAYVNGETQTAIAKRLRISQPAVNEHLRAAKRKLRKSHEDWPDDE